MPRKSFKKLAERDRRERQQQQEKQQQGQGGQQAPSPQPEKQENQAGTPPPPNAWQPARSRGAAAAAQGQTAPGPRPSLANVLGKSLSRPAPAAASSGSPANAWNRGAPSSATASTSMNRPPPSNDRPANAASRGASSNATTSASKNGPAPAATSSKPPANAWNRSRGAPSIATASTSMNKPAPAAASSGSSANAWNGGAPSSAAASTSMNKPAPAAASSGSSANAWNKGAPSSAAASASMNRPAPAAASSGSSANAWNGGAPSNGAASTSTNRPPPSNDASSWRNGASANASANDSMASSSTSSGDSLPNTTNGDRFGDSTVSNIGSPVPTLKELSEMKMSESDESKESRQHPPRYVIPYQKTNKLKLKSPKVGKAGTAVTVWMNQMKISVSASAVFTYDVKPTFPARIRKEAMKIDTERLFKAFEVLKSANPSVFTNPYACVYDGFHMAANNGRLNLPEGGKFDVVTFEEFPGQRVQVRFVLSETGLGERPNGMDLNGEFDLYTSEGRTETRPHQPTQVMQWILSYKAHLDPNWTVLGSQMFPHATNVETLGGGLSLMKGVALSVRPGNKLYLNVDVASKACVRRQDLYDFIAVNLRKDPRNDGHRDFINQAIRRLQCEFERPNGQKRKYFINGLGPRTNEPGSATDANGQSMTIENYFRNEYQYAMRHPGYPSISVGRAENKIYLPMEMVWIADQGLPISKDLNDAQRAAMVKMTAQPPAQRKIDAMNVFRELNYANDPYLKAFGVRIAPDFVKIDARKLKHPALAYKDANTMRDKAVTPFDGKWNTLNKNLCFNVTHKVHMVYILDLVAGVTSEDVETFYQAVTNKSAKLGFPLSKWFRIVKQRNESLEAVMRRVIEKKERDKPPTVFVLVVLPQRPCEEYNPVKFFFDTQNIPTQCIIKKNVKGRLQKQTLHNLCLKINSKKEGTNQKIFPTDQPRLLRNNRKVLFLGADVIHPSPGQVGEKPSIAAMVGSCDDVGAMYNTEIREQLHDRGARQLGANAGAGDNRVREIIADTEGMVSNLLRKYAAARKYLPEHIFYYRDGVSEGQFQHVLEREVPDIKRAFAIVAPKAREPKLTVIVCQKRHHVRFGPINASDGVGAMKNVPPGLVVDTLHPTETTWYLAAHEGIQGTTKPTHFHVLYDDADTSADDLQHLTFCLCHMYARSERSVSLPAPTYYADLAAEHARGVNAEGKKRRRDPTGDEEFRSIKMRHTFM